MNFAQVLGFLVGHLDVIELVAEAIRRGATKQQIKAAIMKAMTELSDEAIREELKGK